jgi:putative methyltransferase (TIGR04325 family)
MAVGQEFYIWEGVYETWDDAPEKEGAFNSTKWIDSQSDVLRKDLNDIREGGNRIPGCAISHDYILPSEGCTRVLDFGGGLASSYASVRSSVEGAAGDLEFHVVENGGICDMAAEILGDEVGLHFHPTLPEDGRGFDVIHAGRSFQYVDDWRGLLRSFAGLRPRYLILAGALAGNIRPFVSTRITMDTG